MQCRNIFAVEPLINSPRCCRREATSRNGTERGTSKKPWCVVPKEMALLQAGFNSRLARMPWRPGTKISKPVLGPGISPPRQCYGSLKWAAGRGGRQVSAAFLPGD